MASAEGHESSLPDGSCDRGGSAAAAADERAPADLPIDSPDTPVAELRASLRKFISRHSGGGNDGVALSRPVVVVTSGGWKQAACSPKRCRGGSSLHKTCFARHTVWAYHACRGRRRPETEDMHARKCPRPEASASAGVIGLVLRLRHIGGTTACTCGRTSMLRPLVIRNEEHPQLCERAHPRLLSLPPNRDKDA
eukprot:356220-Chlamydomonas_euryale.AAC.1